MEIESHMPGNGVIFSEGIEADFITFSYGITAAVTVAEKQDPLVV